MQRVPSFIKYEDALDALNVIEWRITASCTTLDEFKIHFFKKVNDEFTQDESLFGFTYQDVENKYRELKDAEPMRLLRLERNRLLQETDWMANSDVVMTDAWKTYRQALRDLPTTATPEINEYGELINVIWPEKPNG